MKRQLAKRGLRYESLDNGFRWCERRDVLQEVCDELGVQQIEAFLGKWVQRLPFPLTRQDREGGYRHELSVWQMEFSLTHVFGAPTRGREFFEEVIRENLDLGRPDRVQLLFERQITQATPGRFQTRVITSGVHPSLHVEYKNTQIKQYFKENIALRTETTIRDARDFDVGRRLENLPYLKTIARNVNRRLLEVQKVSQNCVLSHEGVQRLMQPTVTPDGQRAPGLKFGDPRVMSLLAALCLFLHLPDGFRNGDLRPHVADLLGPDESDYGPGQMTYDLRRLRLKGIIARVPRSNRYFLTPYGWKAALFVTRLNAGLFRPGLAALDDSPGIRVPHRLRDAPARVDQELTAMLNQARMRRAS